jgi:hypothetical protein
VIKLRYLSAPTVSLWLLAAEKEKEMQKYHPDAEENNVRQHGNLGKNDPWLTDNVLRARDFDFENEEKDKARKIKREEIGWRK